MRASVLATAKREGRVGVFMMGLSFFSTAADAALTARIAA
jgi:hypothetical protein